MRLHESQWARMSLNESEWVWKSLNESQRVSECVRVCQRMVRIGKFCHMIEVENTDVKIVRNFIPMRNHMPASTYGLKAISDWFALLKVGNYLVLLVELCVEFVKQNHSLYFITWVSFPNRTFNYARRWYSYASIHSKRK